MKPSISITERYTTKEGMDVERKMERLSNLGRSVIEKKKCTMCAIVFNKSKVLSIGTSLMIPHRKFCGVGRVYVPSVHAEIDALSRLLNDKARLRKKRLNADLFVISHNSLTSQSSSSKPCKDCIRMMCSGLFSNLKIRNIYYFSKGEIKKESLENIDTEFISSGWRLWYRKFGKK